MAILDKIDSEFFIDSPSFNFMKVLDDNSYLSTQDRTIINYILIGCSKLIMSFNNKPIDRVGKRASRPSKRHLAMLATLQNFAFNASETIAPSDIRKKLPRDLQSIQPSDLSRVLGSLMGIKIFSEAKITGGKRGRKVTDYEDNVARGVKSYYEQDRYFEILKKIIADKNSRALIFFFLAQSRLIHRFLYHTIRLIMYIIKYDKNALNTINHSIYLKEVKMDYNGLYEQLNSVDDKSIASIIDSIAVKKTNELARKIKDDDPVLFYVYLFGGLYFYIN